MSFLDLSGPEFLGFYGLVTLAMVGLRGAFSLALRRPNVVPPEGELADLHVYEVAYLAGGAPAAIRAAVTTLLHEGALEAVGKAVRANKAIREQPHPGKVQSELYLSTHPLDTAILNRASLALGVSVVELNEAEEATADRLSQRLEHRVMLIPNRWTELARTLLPLVFAGVVGIGAARLWLGISRGRPVAFVVVALGIAAFLGFWVAQPFPRRTKKGDQALALLQRDNKALTQLPSDAMSSREVALVSGIFGGSEPTAETAVLGVPVDGEGSVALEFGEGGSLCGVPGRSCGGGSCCGTCLGGS